MENEPQAVFEQTGSGAYQFVLRDIAQALSGICTELAGIRGLMQSSRDASEALQAKAQAVLDAHQQHAQDYLDQVEFEPPIDPFPFVELPAGTVAKNLPDGNRVFTLPDGVVLSTNNEHDIVVSENGTAKAVRPGPGPRVQVAPGTFFDLAPEYLRITHEAAGIEGLPWNVEPIQVAEDRFSVTLPGDIRLEVNHALRMATVVNPSGTVNLIGSARIEGIGEKAELHLIGDGSKGFSFVENMHGGLVEADGTIRLALAGDRDLVIRFPPLSADEPGSPRGKPRFLVC